MKNNKMHIKEFYYEIDSKKLKEYLKMPPAMKIKWLEETCEFFYKVKNVRKDQRLEKFKKLKGGKSYKEKVEGRKSKVDK